MKTNLDQKICELWNVSRTALSASHDCGRHSRMCYVKNELIKNHAKMVEGMTGKQIWFAIEDQLN